MGRGKRSTEKDLTFDEIAHRARLIRKSVGIHHRAAFNLLHVFELLKKVLPRLKTRTVPDVDLLGVEARAYPDEWLIKLRQGILDGLLRNDAGARWTFTHELGHLVLRHPGKPFRKRTIEDEPLVEHEAHVFAAEFLAPSDLASECQSPEEIRRRFGLSARAASRRFTELNRKKVGQKYVHQLNNDIGQLFHFEDQAACLCKSISRVIDENLSPSMPIEPFKNNLFSSATAAAKGAQLLADSYESIRGLTTHARLISAASLAAATIIFCPIREIGASSSRSNHILLLNQMCALDAAMGYLGYDLKDLRYPSSDDGRSRAIYFKGDYLLPFLSLVDREISTSANTLYFQDYPTYSEYNGEFDISWSEIHQIEKIATLIGLIVNNLFTDKSSPS